MDYSRLLSMYDVFFEGMKYPVFYYDLLPTSLLEESNQWERYRFGHGLKYISEFEEKEPNLRVYFEENTDAYYNVLHTFFVELSSIYSGINIGVVAIPSSYECCENVVTSFTKTTISKVKLPNIFDLTSHLVRKKTKERAHDGGTRNMYENIESLEFIPLTSADIDVIVVLDDIVTSGNSFNAINEIIQESTKINKFINFAFCRSMCESAHFNIDYYKRFKQNIIKSKSNVKVDAIIFDLDQTIIDSSCRNGSFEDQIQNVEFCSTNAVKYDKVHFIKFLKAHGDVYKPYPAISTILDSGIPFAIVTNSWKKRVMLILQMNMISLSIYPEVQCNSYEIRNLDNRVRYEQYHGESYMQDGSPWRYSNQIPRNVFCAPYLLKSNESNNSSNRIRFAKPNQRAVNNAIEWLESEFHLKTDKRIIGVGNTVEDMIAYRFAGIESVLALWGVPDYLKSYAIANWEFDYIFITVKEFNSWLTSLDLE